MTHLAETAGTGNSGNNVVGPRRPSLRPLTGARFLAAIGVVAFHVDFHFGAVDGVTAAERFFGPSGLLPNLINAVSGLGSLGVNFFFVLSGFILAYNYQGQTGLNTTSRAFYLARFARIYPVYLVALLLAFAFRSVGSPCSNAGCQAGDNGFVAAASVVLLQAWLPFVGDAFNGPAWTLSVETFFYACFPFLLTRIIRMRRPRTLILTGVAMVAATQVGPLIAAVATEVHGSVPVGLGIVAQFSPIVRLPEFVLGVLGGCWLLRRGLPRAFSGWRADLVLLAGMPILVVLGKVMVRSGIPPISANNGLFDVVFLMLILALASRRGRINTVLSRPIAQTLGESSYALYILHWPVWFWLSSQVSPETRVGAPFLAIYVVVVVSLSVVAWRTIERPARRLVLRRRSDARARPHGTASG